MGEQDLSKLFYKVSCSQATLVHCGVDRMGAEVERLLLKSLFDWNSIDDVLLGSVFDCDEAQSQLDVFSFNHPFSVGTFVHDIDLGDDSDGSHSLWINLSCHLKTVRSGHISISWQHTENNCSRIAHISVAHSFSDLLDVFSLVGSCHRNSSDTRQINKRKIRTSVGVNGENNRFVDDVLALAANFVCKILNR